MVASFAATILRCRAGTPGTCALSRITSLGQSTGMSPYWIPVYHKISVISSQSNYRLNVPQGRSSGPCYVILRVLYPTLRKKAQKNSAPSAVSPAAARNRVR